MIDQLETILIDVPPTITSREIESFIKMQMITHYPEPERLIYDYIITGKKGNSTLLITYMLKEDLLKDEMVLHPHLLVKHHIWKRGSYHIKWKERELFLQLKQGRVSTLESDPEEIKHLINKETETILPNHLEKLYKKCKKDMFNNNRKPLSYPLLISVLLTAVIFIPIYISIQNYNSNKITLENLEKRYQKLVNTKSDQSEEDKLFNITLEEVLKMESHISPSIYLLLSQLVNTQTKVVIKDFSYSGNQISLTLLTTNSLELLKELNCNPYLKMSLTNTVPGEDLELSQYIGEILCP